MILLVSNIPQRTTCGQTLVTALALEDIFYFISKDDLLGFQSTVMLATVMVLAVGWPATYGTKEAKATWHYIFRLHQGTRMKLQYSCFKV